MSKRIIWFLLGFTAVALFTSCQNQPESAVPAPDGEKGYVVEGELPSSPVAQGWIDEAANDLSTQLDTPIGEIQFVDFELVVWPDGSYGCPADDETYPVETKEGYKIHLRSNSRLYFYHGGEEIEQFLCQS